MMENFGAFGGVIYMALVILMIIAQWKIYEKAGEPGWACIIPIYQAIVLLRIVGKPWWWLFLLIFLPFIFVIWTANLLSKSFGHGVGFTLGLLFLPFIFFPILGLGDSTYQGAAGK
jgi:hypothetical protein